jgi:adenylate cyclase
MVVAANLLYGPWVIAALTSSTSITLSSLVPHSAFMASTMLIASITTYTTYLLRRAELETRLKLEEQLTISEKVIEKKTNEGVYLEKLTTQFSPQVVKAIKDGEISLDTRIRRQITCIFIDIENSTGRSRRLDYETYTGILSDFFSRCSELLLEHNVTIGTYLGDGMMAFVNAPGLTENHQATAVEACLAVLREHRKMHNYFKEKWRTDFNIRIGINAGYSSVGFFPDFKRGTYTAVGETINLTSRLCAHAEPNSICVTKTFLKNIANDIQDGAIFPLELKSPIKGYESDFMELLTVRPVLNDNEIVIQAENSCPVCEGLLRIQADLGGTFLIACTKCDHIDIVAKNQNKQPELQTEA